MASAPDKTVVTTSFELAVTGAARLAAYADVGEFIDDEGEIGTRQTQLAIDDAVSLAISLRRLITALDLHGEAKAIDVPKLALAYTPDHAIVEQIVDRVDLWSLINKLVHSVEIEIVQFSYQAIPSLSIAQAYRLALERRSKRIRPVCRIRSDNGQTVQFRLLTLCEAAGKMLSLATEKAISAKIYLGSMFDN